MNRMWQNQITCVILLLALTTSSNGQDESTNQAPIADVGLPRYAATAPIELDSTSSYDPDDSGLLTYAWQQIAGPSVVITDANTAIPTISGFILTDEIQECEFELIVNDGELTSVPDTDEGPTACKLALCFWARPPMKSSKSNTKILITTKNFFETSMSRPINHVSSPI